MAKSNLKYFKDGVLFLAMRYEALRRHADYKRDYCELQALDKMPLPGVDSKSGFEKWDVELGRRSAVNAEIRKKWGVSALINPEVALPFDSIFEGKFSKQSAIVLYLQGLFKDAAVQCIEKMQDLSPVWVKQNLSAGGLFDVLSKRKVSPERVLSFKGNFPRAKKRDRITLLVDLNRPAQQIKTEVENIVSFYHNAPGRKKAKRFIGEPSRNSMTKSSRKIFDVYDLVDENNKEKRKKMTWAQIGRKIYPKYKEGADAALVSLVREQYSRAKELIEGCVK